MTIKQDREEIGVHPNKRKTFLLSSEISNKIHGIGATHRKGKIKFEFQMGKN